MKDPFLPRLPKKHDLRKYAIGVTKAPRCPLCLELMVKKWITQRGLFAWTCDTVGSCKIAIRVDDPFVGRWDAAAAKVGVVPCHNPRCDESPMRLFFTGVNFMKAFCPKCKATMTMGQVDERPETPIHTPENLGDLQGPSLPS